MALACHSTLAFGRVELFPSLRRCPPARPPWTRRALSLSSPPDPPLLPLRPSPATPPFRASYLALTLALPRPRLLPPFHSRPLSPPLSPLVPRFPAGICYRRTAASRHPSLPLTGGDEVRGGANRFGDAVRSGWWNGGGHGWRQTAGKDGVVNFRCTRGGRENIGGGGEGGRANYPACAGDAMWGVEGAFNCLCGLIAGHLGVVDATGRIANRDGILLVPRADGGMAL